MLFVQGDGGVGKSALLRMYADNAAEAGYAVVRIDGHDVRPNPESFLQAAGPGVGLGPVVVLVDTYELLEPLDDWLREEFVPGLSDGSLVVIAGRRALPPGWLSDPGWRELLRVIRLGNLGVDDATRYLAAAGVPADLHAATAAAVHGHPLALVLVADVLAERGRAALEGPVLSDVDVLAALVSRLLDVVPDEVHRRALAVCALARFTTESLLQDVLEVEDARRCSTGCMACRVLRLARAGSIRTILPATCSRRTCTGVTRAAIRNYRVGSCVGSINGSGSRQAAPAGMRSSTCSS